MIANGVDGASTEKASRLLHQYVSERHRYVHFASSMERLLGQLLNSDASHVEISARAKDPESLRKKLAMKNYDELSSIPDLAGIRLVVSYTSDLQAVCSIIRSEFEVVEEVPHGFGQPDAFGYASQHMIIRLNSSRSLLSEWITFADLHCEVQVRTILQHAWASISHSLDYKTDQEIPGEVKRKLYQVAALIEVGDNLFESFRSDVEELRERYARLQGAEAWKSLPINHDAVEATLTNIPLDGLIDKLTAASIGVVEHSLYSKEKRAHYISAIVERSNNLGLHSMGALSRALNERETLELWERFIPEYLKRNPDGPGYFTVDFIVALTLRMLLRNEEMKGDGKLFAPSVVESAAIAQQREKPSSRK